MKKIWACWYAVEPSPQHTMCVRDTQCDDQKTCKKNVHTASNLTRYVCMPRCMRKSKRENAKETDKESKNIDIPQLVMGRNFAIYRHLGAAIDVLTGTFANEDCYVHITFVQLV